MFRPRAVASRAGARCAVTRSCRAGWPLPGLLALAACAVPHPGRVQPGQDEAEMLAAMGPPTARYALATGWQRVEFARGPSGRSTWMVDLDGSGRVRLIEQVLDTQHFARVADGMARDELLQLLGRPAARQREWQQRETWSWRYETNDCLWFRVTLDATGRVIHGGALMPDPACDANDHRAP